MGTPPPWVQGSSPLTRGKRADNGHAAALGGLIPAHAGKTPSVDVAVSFSGAHPRSRGENREPYRDSSVRGGSSPLTRGKPGMSVRSQTVRGLIPAHAGKTRNARILGNKLGAHPRSRGENLDPYDPETWKTGSSPLTRGKR